jgi:membrane protein DedA with SNARE-associated domain
VVLITVAAALSNGSQPALPGFLEALASPLQHYGLWAIFALVLIEDFGIPVPGETVIIAAAIYAGSGRLNVVGVGVVAFVAAVLGDNIGYGIGRFGGRRLVDRWGKYVFLTPERLDKAEAFFDRQGAKIITIARFIEGLRQANGIIAGIAKMHWLRFIAYNALGAALWVGTWVSIGYFAGQHINAIYGVITRYSLYVAIAAVVLIVALIARHIMRKRRRVLRAAAGPGGAGSGGSSGEGEAVGDGSGEGEGEAAGRDEAAGPHGTDAAAASDAAGSGGDEASAEEAGVVRERSEPPAGADSAARTDADHVATAQVDADHVGDADDDAESGSSGQA